MIPLAHWVGGPWVLLAAHTRCVTEAGLGQWPSIWRYSPGLWSLGAEGGGGQGLRPATEASGASRELEEEPGASAQVLSRMPGLCLEEASAQVPGMSTHLGDPKESLRSPGSPRPSELIALGPGGSARQEVLRKIQELSDSVWREVSRGF